MVLFNLAIEALDISCESLSFKKLTSLSKLMCMLPCVCAELRSAHGLAFPFGSPQARQMDQEWIPEWEGIENILRTIPVNKDKFQDSVVGKPCV